VPLFGQPAPESANLARVTARRGRRVECGAANLSTTASGRSVARRLLPRRPGQQAAERENEHHDEDDGYAGHVWCSPVDSWTIPARVDREALSLLHASITESLCHRVGTTLNGWQIARFLKLTTLSAEVNFMGPRL
jgi:hypothetical protein